MAIRLNRVRTLDMFSDRQLVVCSAASQCAVRARPFPHSSRSLCLTISIDAGAYVGYRAGEFNGLGARSGLGIFHFGKSASLSA